jgi:F-type H+-transporting ATPase subunit alpha
MILLGLYFSYDNLLRRGIRIALRAKVNDSVITGLRVVDSVLPVGRGQRQLILGDRYTGKTSLFLSTMLQSLGLGILGTMDGLGTKRLFGLYVGLNQSLNRLSKLIVLLGKVCWFIFILGTHSSSSSLLSFMVPLIGVTMAERLRDRGFDVLLMMDDLSKHARSYRQISLLSSRIPSRDAYSADIFNVHSSILERVGIGYGFDPTDIYCGSITCLPIIETVNNNISEFIATNVISITDGQLYYSKYLFNLSCRPAIDSSLSVTRIGSNAQCK